MTSITHNRVEKKTIKINRNSKIFKTIIQAIHNKKAENIVSLDLRKIPEAAADFFIICSANNSVQLRAIKDFIEDEVKEKCGEMPFKKEGATGQQWQILDYINIVIHIMHPETRTYYKLEEMWNDADAMPHEI